MITEMFLNLIASALGGLINLILEKLPTADIGSNLIDRIVAILEIGNQSINFVHFIVGDTLVIIIPIVTALLVYKYIVYPIVDLIRRLIPFVNL